MYGEVEGGGLVLYVQQMADSIANNKRRSE